MKQFILLLAIVCLSSSCDKYDADEQHVKDIAEIEDYLNANNIAYQKTPGGVYYFIDEEGDNNGSPTIDNTVECEYIGFFFDAFVEDAVVSTFDRTPMGETRAFPLLNVIEGWQEGIPVMSRGALGRFFIPSTMAYGNRKVGSIGKNEILIFDINLRHFY